MTHIRYRIFAMNFFACLINYGDRVALSVAAPFILQEFDFSPAIWGVILSAFFWTYSPFALIGGLIADKVGIRLAYTLCMLTWSLTIPLTAGAWSIATFIIARLLFGAGEGPQAPISTKLTATWFPLRQTSTMLNLAQAGTTIGPVLAIPVIVWSSTHIGWRTTFIMLAALGLVWTIMWWFTARDKPSQHPKVNQAEIDHITADHESGAQEPTKSNGFPLFQRSFWRLLATKYVASIALAFFAYSWVLFMFLTWYPQYLVEARGVSESELAGMATIPWITATVGLIAGGFGADWLIKRTGSLVTSRKWIMVGCLVVTAVCFGPSAFVTSPTVGLILVSIATMFLLASYQYQALVVAMAPSTLTGSLAGVIQMCSTLAGIFAPIVTGAVVEVTGTYTMAYTIAAVIVLVGAGAVALFVKGGERAAPPASPVTVPATQ